MSKSIYPSIPAPGNDINTIRASLDAMRQTLTMVIMNAQNPSSTFTPSSAAQVFVTQEQLKSTGVVGPPGQTGPQGPPGPGIDEAPNDVHTYGRHALDWAEVTEEAPANANTYGRSNKVWVQVLDASEAVFETLPTNAANDAAAATAGVVVGGVYRNGSILMVRVV